MKIFVAIVLALCAVGFGDVNIPEKDLLTGQSLELTLSNLPVNTKLH